jgi:predicted RNase H-like HicB family nuclease
MSQPSSNSPEQIIQVPCTGVLVQLTIKSGINPQTLMPHMPAEVRDTVVLYLEGHISQWWALCDLPGVVFLFTETSVDAVQQLMSALPLVKEDLVDLTFTRLGPLTPLRILVNVRPGAPVVSAESFPSPS